jgi:hypothetical protein
MMNEAHTSGSKKQVIIHKGFDGSGRDTFLVCWMRGRHCYHIDYFSTYKEAINYIKWS